MPAPKRLGRPVDPVKTDAILDATRTLFVAEGSAGLSIERVAALASVSKVTIYRQFTDRAGLLTALVSRETQWMQAGLEKPTLDSFKQAMVDWAVRQMSFLTRPDVRAFDARISAEVGLIPDLALTIYMAGPQALHDILTIRMRDAIADGEILAAQPGPAAALFMAMLWSTEPPDQLRGLTPPPGPDERRRRAEQAVGRFLAIWGCGDKSLR